MGGQRARRLRPRLAGWPRQRHTPLPLRLPPAPRPAPVQCCCRRRISACRPLRVPACSRCRNSRFFCALCSWFSRFVAAMVTSRWPVGDRPWSLSPATTVTAKEQTLPARCPPRSVGSRAARGPAPDAEGHTDCRAPWPQTLASAQPTRLQQTVTGNRAPGTWGECVLETESRPGPREGLGERWAGLREAPQSFLGTSREPSHRATR